MRRSGWFVFFVLLICGCGVPRPYRLTWPAKVMSIEVEGDAHSSIETYIADLNTNLGNPILDIQSGSGSPVYIKKVESFDKNAFGHVAYIGIPGARGLLGTRIAGRATLTDKQCLIELGSFLMDESMKDLLLPVLWHEIGHCGGLAHVSEDNEVMSPVTLHFKNYNQEQLDRFFKALTASIRNK